MDITPIDIHDRLAGMMPEHTPEAVSVLVVGTHDADVAAQVGPLLAKRLYPDRHFGRTLHVDDTPDGFEVAVHAVGTPLSAVTITSGNGR